MQKTTKIMILIIGALCIAGGTFHYTEEGATFEVLFAFFIGLCLILSVFFGKGSEVELK